jgi:DNA-binding NtrC family response regulator
VPELARHFLARFAAEEGKRLARLSADAVALLAAYRWPGNVRQLENAIFRAVVLSEGDDVGVAEFPQIAALVGRGAATPDSVPMTGVTPSPLPPYEVAFDAPSLADAAPMPAPGRSEPPAHVLQGGPALALLDPQGEIRSLDSVETEVIRFAIAHYRGQMSEVARKLQIGRSTLYRKLDALGLGHDGPNSDMESVVTG